MLDVRAYFEGREVERASFLKTYVGEPFTAQPLAQDWASRRYFRVNTADKNFVLMETVPDHIPTATMGHKLSAYLKISKMLHDKGMHTPDIYAVDEKEGFVLLEDLGDMTCVEALNGGADAMKIYGAATDVLIAMRNQIGKNELCDFPKYKDSYIRKGRQRIVDWYLPVTRGAKNSDTLLESYLEAWDAVSAALPSPQIGFIHGDFHLGNLMLLPQGGCGVLDFQDAMAGPVVYDLANLLENIRLDVPGDVYEAMKAHYGMDEGAQAWFRVMAAQFHCRIIGQVLRLAIVSGKTDLMKYMPRIQHYLIEGLKDPVLKPLADWFEAEGVNLYVTHFDIEAGKDFIRDDAF